MNLQSVSNPDIPGLHMTHRRRRRLLFLGILAGGLLCVLVGSVRAGTGALLHVSGQEVSWGDPDLQSKLLDRLSGRNGLAVTLIDDTLWRSNPENTSFVSVPHLVKVGAERRQRFVIDIANLRSELGVRKGFSVPLALSRYSAIGAISGTLRIVDSERGRLIHEEDFEITKRGPSEWQVFENNPRSGGLNIPAAEKPAFLEALEWRAAGKLADTILKKMKLK